MAVTSTMCQGLMDCGGRGGEVQGNFVRVDRVRLQKKKRNAKSMKRYVCVYVSW